MTAEWKCYDWPHPLAKRVLNGPVTRILRLKLRWSAEFVVSGKNYLTYIMIEEQNSFWSHLPRCFLIICTHKHSFPLQPCVSLIFSHQTFQWIQFNKGFQSVHSQDGSSSHPWVSLTHSLLTPPFFRPLQLQCQIRYVKCSLHVFLMFALTFCPDPAVSSVSTVLLTLSDCCSSDCCAVAQ